MIINQVGGGSSGGDGPSAVATVQLNYAVSGIRITATSSGLPTEVGVTDATGLATISNLKEGTYTFSTDGGASASQLIDMLRESLNLTVTRVTVTSPNTGVTQITATKDGVTITKPYDSGAVFYDLSVGTWTFSDGTDTSTLSLDPGVDAQVMIGILRTSIYGWGDQNTVDIFLADSAGNRIGSTLGTYTWSVYTVLFSERQC